MGAGGVPGPELIDGLIILISGVLLLTPGFLTDLTGLVGLLPPTRAVLRRALTARFERAVREGSVRVASGAASRMGGFATFGGPFGGPLGGAGAPPPVEDAEVIEQTSRPLRDGEAAPEA